MDIVSFGLASKVSKAIETLIGNSKLTIPSGTTTERPVLPASNKAIRFNTDTNGLESWDGAEWGNISASVTAVTIKGTDTEANILLKSGDAGDVWVASETLDGWLYDGTNWLNIGTLQGPKGIGITSITLDSTEGLVDTYVITYSDTTTSTYGITNGKDGAAWLSGSIDPTTEGVAEDMYLNTNSYDVFKKIAGTWTFQTNIKGAAGEGLTILGSLNDETLLPATGNAGEGYIITGYLYVWTGIEWENVGLIQGPQGIQGEIGPQGIQGEIGNGISTVLRTAGDGSPGTTDTYTVTFTDTTTTTFEVYNGSNGLSIDHVTRTTGDGSAGTVDTYTAYLDVAETEIVGTFEVYNGQDGGGAINDATITTTTLWSSEKTNNEILAMAIALG